MLLGDILSMAFVVSFIVDQ